MKYLFLINILLFILLCPKPAQAIEFGEPMTRETYSDMLWDYASSHWDSKASQWQYVNSHLEVYDANHTPDKSRGYYEGEYLSLSQPEFIEGEK